MLLETLGASELANMLTGKGAVRAGRGHYNINDMHNNFWFLSIL